MKKIISGQSYFVKKVDEITFKYIQEHQDFFLRSDFILEKSFFKVLDNKEVLLFYKWYNIDVNYIEGLKDNYCDYIIKIFPVLQELIKDSKNANRAYIHNDPQPDNVIFNDDKIFFIDIESIKFDLVVFQILYLFVKFYLDEEYNSCTDLEVFECIIEHASSHSIFSEEIMKYLPDKLIELFILKLDKQNDYDMMKGKKFFKANYDFCTKVIQKYCIYDQ